jgi:hypothetical protein
MDFLRRLATPRESTAGRAVAILPSRYANDRPLRAAPLALSTSEDERQDRGPVVNPPGGEAPAADAAAARQTPGAEGVPPQPSARTGPARPPTDSPVAREISSPALEGPPEATAGGAAVRRPAEATSRDGRALRRPAAPRHNESAPSQAALAPREFAVSSAPRRRGAPQAATALPASVASAATAAARPVLTRRERPPANQPPVIHVTIDRIDVRAPAAPRTPAASATSRAIAASVSLGDYLRARRPGSTRGAS